MHGSIAVRVFVEDSCRSDHNLETYRSAINFYVDTLFKSVIINSEATIKVTLQCALIDDETNGSCEGLTWEEDGSGPDKPRRTINILVNTGNTALEVLSTIAHELIHTKQFLTGQTVLGEDGSWYWKGKSYGTDPYCGDTEIDSQLPWEYDAYGNDAKLAKKFTNHYFSNW